MEAVNKHLMKNQLQLETNGVKRKYLCDICEKLPCNPKVGRCSCKYCASCLSANTNENNKCPSCKLDLNFETDVASDIRLENKILQVEVKCPNKFCNGRYTINDLNTHLETCDNKGSKCLFHMYGCSVFVSSDSDMHDHLSRDLKYHLDLLLNNISENENRKDEKINGMDRQINENKNKINNEINRIDREINDKINRIDQEKLESNNKMTKLHRDFEQLKESMDAKILICKAAWKWALLKMRGEMNKIIEEKIAENSKLREKLNEKPKVAEVGEHFVVGDGQYKVTFGDMDQKIKNKKYESEIFTLNNYEFKIGMHYTPNRFIQFAVWTVKGNNTQSKWPLTNKLTLTLLGKDGRVYNNHKFSYATSTEDWKNCYNGRLNNGALLDSIIAAWDYCIINNNEVSVILTMEE